MLIYYKDKTKAGEIQRYALVISNQGCIISSTKDKSCAKQFTSHTLNSCKAFYEKVRLSQEAEKMTKVRCLEIFHE